jgi:hypothetical protein
MNKNRLTVETNSLKLYTKYSSIENILNSYRAAYTLGNQQLKAVSNGTKPINPNRCKVSANNLGNIKIQSSVTHGEKRLTTLPSYRGLYRRFRRSNNNGFFGSKAVGSFTLKKSFREFYRSYVFSGPKNPAFRPIFQTGPKQILAIRTNST